jgi:hypothetical protein
MTRYKVGSLFGILPNASIDRLLSRTLVLLAKLKVARTNAPLVVVLLLVAPVPIARSQNASAPLPSRLGTYLRDVVRLTSEEQRQLAAGEPVTKLLDGDESKEVAVFGAIWIKAPIRRYADAVRDIENFERGGGFKVTKRISSPPRPEDFAQLQLPPDDVADLRACRVDDCELKLGEEALNRFRSQIDWNVPDTNASANRLMRQLALEYTVRYLKGGNDSLAVYRDTTRPTFVAQEFRSMVDSMPELTTYMPDIRKHLLEYPTSQLPNATSLLYWQETEFGLKPTLRISHLTVREGPSDAVVVSKMLYASHYFWTGLELRALVSDPARGSGFWFVTVNRSRSDGLSGSTGTFLRRRVRTEVQEGAMAGLRVTKQKMED